MRYPGLFSSGGASIFFKTAKNSNYSLAYQSPIVLAGELDMMHIGLEFGWLYNTFVNSRLIRIDFAVTGSARN
jgi:hypothetical protein